MGRPYVDQLDGLRAMGVTAIVTLTERPLALTPEAGTWDVLHEAVVDFQPPTQEQLLRIVRWMRDRAAADKTIAVHCMAGIGRTGTVLAAWLVAGGATPTQAVRTVRERRPGSIETRAQEEAVAAFATTWAAAADEASA